MHNVQASCCERRSVARNRKSVLAAIQRMEGMGGAELGKVLLCLRHMIPKEKSMATSLKYSIHLAQHRI